MINVKSHYIGYDGKTIQPIFMPSNYIYQFMRIYVFASMIVLFESVYSMTVELSEREGGDHIR
ncbi:hypothetical protein BLOT_011084 [Blomia tropicalis]|nr:hypothetical protein BLOT_011084 [Blomia tropicalis]